MRSRARLRAGPHPPQFENWGTFPKGEGIYFDQLSPDQPAEVCQMAQ